MSLTQPPPVYRSVVKGRWESHSKPFLDSTGVTYTRDLYTEVHIEYYLVHRREVKEDERVDDLGSIPPWYVMIPYVRD